MSDTSQPPERVTVAVLSGLNDMAAMHLQHGRMGRALDIVAREWREPLGAGQDTPEARDMRLGRAWRQVQEIFGTVQLYGITMLGYEANPEAMHAFAKAAHEAVVDAAKTPAGQSSLKDLDAATADLWRVIIRRTFDVKQPLLDASKLRPLSLSFCARVMDPAMRKVADEIKAASRKVDQADYDANSAVSDQVNGRIIVPAMRHGLLSAGLEPSDEMFALAQASLATNGSKDPLTSQNYTHAVMILMDIMPGPSTTVFASP